ncbi:MAG: ParB/RepB/Spo0J family partition protein [Candidatus Paceibacterota bacterium]|jgi:ParB family chromosome partitioning protein
MLGRGLESLIPNKKGGSSGGSFVYGSDDGGGTSDRDVSAGVANQNDSASVEDFANDRGAQPHAVFQNDQEERAETSQRSVDDIPRISGPIFHIEIEKIVLNPYQPRTDFDQEALKELASSIREFGILQPLVVSKTEEESAMGTRVTYQLIAGQRRLMASKLLGLSTVPVVIRNALKKTEALEMAIVENIQRADLNVIETARAYARLSDEFGLTQREIAARLGKSREVVANALRLLSLPSEIQDAVGNGTLSESQARLLLQVSDPQRQKEMFAEAVRGGLSVRDLKKRMAKTKEASDAGVIFGQNIRVNDIEMKGIEKALSEFLGTPVSVEFARGGGKIVIHFYSPEEAMGIMGRIKREEI